MYIDRILYPVTSLGPGRRIALWVAGCSRHCAHCANPELWQRHEQQKITPQKLAAAVRGAVQGTVDGITISGGEPFEQAQELTEFLDALSFRWDVLVFTGYRYADLQQPEAKRLLSRIDVLIDGEYRDELNDNRSALRGSSNQTIRYLNEAVRQKYEEYIAKGRTIQNFIYDYKTISVGIHNRGK